PSAASGPAGSSNQRVPALPVVVVDLFDPTGRVGEGLAVRREHGLDGEASDPPEGLEIIAQRIRARLGMEADVGTDLGEQVVAREEEAALRPVEAAVPGRVARGPDRRSEEHT